jgi:hypothetical protein
MLDKERSLQLLYINAFEFLYYKQNKPEYPEVCILHLLTNRYLLFCGPRL